MEVIKKCTKAVSYGLATMPLSLISKSSFASDLLSNALEGDVQDSLGGDAKFWKIFTLVAIMLATGAAVSTKNPMVFLGVMAVAFIPTFLIRTFVF
jgi:ABC-type Fe3+-siderophore transport system permease subunit